MLKILVVDDHSIVRNGLKNIIKSHFKDAEIDEAFDGDSAISKFKKNNFNLIILDMNMPNTDFFNLLHITKTVTPNSKILLFTLNSEFLFAKKFFKLGIDGYISKGCDESTIIEAIQLVLNNQKFISPDLKEYFAVEIIDGVKENPINSLTHRELEIALHLVRGVSINEVCNILYLKQSTVATHKARILAKCNKKNLFELFEFFKINNII
jgi:DNA-binding NarL/FixJ family response regulator